MVTENGRPSTPDSGELDSIDLSNLRLNAGNPRIRAYVEPDTSEHDILAILWEKMDVEEIAISIALSGYWEHEALLVIPADGEEQSGDFIVVEGNRRLAAVKILLDPELRIRFGSDELDKAVEQGVGLENLDRCLPVVKFADPRALWSYVGFQHVSGIKAWDSFSKGAYVAQVHEDFKIPLADIARAIGDRHESVRRFYRGFTVNRQAEAELGFSHDDCATSRFYFSHLYTALDQEPFLAFLGMDRENSLQQDPVPADHRDNLRELMTWLYGSASQSIRPVITRQYPDLNVLRNVLTVPEAIQVLRETNDLAAAQRVAVGETTLFITALRDGLRRVRYAYSLAPEGYDGGDEGWRELQRIKQVLDMLEVGMSLKREQSG